MTFNNTDRPLEILTRTNDGDDLAPHHLKLLENAVNGRLNDNGEAAFETLFTDVLAGYAKPWFRNVEHITIEWIETT
jgi:hypothetical protein